MALSRKRPYAEAEALPELHTVPYDFPKRTKSNAYVAQQTSPTEMGPPPTPIDPNLEPLHASPTQKFGLDQLLPTAPDLQQRPLYPREINLAPNFYQEGQVSSMRPSNLELNPSLNSHPDPWDSQRINGRIAQPQLMNQSYTGARERSYQDGPPAYWDTRSDIDSTTGRHVPDSGYYTGTHGTGSIYSGDLVSNPEGQSFTGGMTETESTRDGMHFSTSYQGEHSMDPSSGLPEEQQQEYQSDLICHLCQHKSKNRSESSKHKLRHEKPFKCDVEGCSRVVEGFTTQNDLERHKKSLHNVMTGKSFMCAVQHCAKKTKVWPRADNFRQHCQRLHKDHDLNELMDRSWERGSRLACNPGKEFGLIEAPPNDGRLLSFDPNQSQLANPQEINRAPNHHMPMEMCQPPSSTALSVDGHHKPTTNNAFSEQGRDHINDFRMITSGHHGMTLDPRDAPLSAKMKDLPESYPTRSMSESSKVGHMGKFKERSISDSSTLPPNNNDLRARTTGTSGSSGLTRDDLASIFSAVADRLDLNEYNSKEDIILAIQTSALSLLAPNKSKKRGYTDSPSKDATLDLGKQFQCRYCNKKKKAHCELRKHEKRHTRPYGCTYSNCPRRFGSKDDWKRHENTMHWQVEAWKCAESRDKPNAITNPAYTKVQNEKKNECGLVFYRREQFQAHLDEAHRVKDPEIVRKQCKLRRVGRNGQRGFWCGFCQTVVSLKKRGLEAWDERFTHIDEEHFKKGQRVDDWFPMDKELPKGILDEEKQDSGSGEEAAASESESGPPTASEIGPIEQDSITYVQPRSERKAPELAKKITASEWICCRCNNGPLIHNIHPSCFMAGCGHQRCGSCRTERRGNE